MQEHSSSQILNSVLIREYFNLFENFHGTPKDYQNIFQEFRNSTIQTAINNGHSSNEQLARVITQLDNIELLRTGFSKVSTDFGFADQPPPAQPQNTTILGQGVQQTQKDLPIDDQEVLAKLVGAMEKGDRDTVHDMHDTAPFQHWRDDMNLSDFEKIAQRFLVSDTPIFPTWLFLKKN
jgi:hypothetical protein